MSQIPTQLRYYVIKILFALDDIPKICQPLLKRC